MGHPGGFEEGMVSLNDLHVATYQRPLDRTQIDAIDRNFLPDLARQIQVARRENGDLYVLDGQHTLEVLKRRGFTEWSARFHDGLTYEEEAFRFVWYNESTRRVQPIYKFKARLEAQNDATKAIAKTLADHGLAVPGTETTTNFVPIRSVTMLDRIYELGGGELLSTVLAVAKQAWGSKADPTKTYNTRVIPGLARLLLCSTRPLDVERLVAALQTKDLQPEALEKLVKGVAGSNAIVAKKIYVAYLNGAGLPDTPRGRKAYRLRQDAHTYPYLAVQPVELGTMEIKKMGVWSQQSDMTMQKKVEINKPRYLDDLHQRLAQFAQTMGNP